MHPKPMHAPDDPRRPRGTCLGCPFAKRGLSYVPGMGPSTARVAVLGQGPGRNEAVTGTPFVEHAPSGAVLTRWLHTTGHPLLLRPAIWVDNVVRCLLKSGKSDEAPPAAIGECWHRHVGPALEALPHLTHVVAVGTAASTFLLGHWARMSAAGSFIERDLPAVWPEEVF